MCYLLRAIASAARKTCSSMLHCLFLVPALAVMVTGDVVFDPIKEETPPGRVIGNIGTKANLASLYNSDELPHLRFKFVKNEGITQYLRLIEKTGELKTRLRIDRDSLCETINACCPTFYGSGPLPGPATPAASSSRGPVCRITFAVRIYPVRYFRLIRVTIGVEDINDNAPAFDTPRRNFKVSETALPNTEISLPMAKDPDAGRNAITDYHLTGGDNVFQLKINGNARDGFSKLSLVTRRNLDREKKSWYACNITAMDSGIPRRSGTLQVNITITDDNDCVPVFLNSSYVAHVPEDHSLQKPIIRLFARDDDSGENGRVSFTVDPSAKAEVLNTFQVNSATGEVYLHKALDYESRKHFTVPVLAVDNGLGKRLSAHTVVRVNVIDVNDQKPTISVVVSSDYGNVEVPENQNPNFAIATISVSDRDAGENGEVDCDLEQGKNSFQLSSALSRSDSSSEAFYALKSLVRFDREKQEKYHVVIVCSDHGRPSRTAVKSFDVRVTDINDNSPHFRQRIYVFKIREGNNPRAEIGQLHAKDADSHKNGRVQYFLDPADDRNVALDLDTGRLVARRSFDREQLKAFTVRVIATDMGIKKRFSATATVSVTILDENDNTPEIKLVNRRLEVEENIDVGTEVTTLVAVDPDEGRNGQVVFATRTSTKFFHLSRAGRLTVAGRLDREEDKEHTLVVVAHDNGDIPRTSTATITIMVTDVNDHAPRFIIPSPDNKQVNITTDYRTGSIVTRFVARDDDEGLNGEVKFRLKMQPDSPDSIDDLPFFLNEETGDLKLIGHVDRKRSSYRLWVEAYDQGVPPRTTLSVMEIRVLDGPRRSGGNRVPKNVKLSTVPNTIVMLVACMIIVVLIVLLFLLICIVYRRNKRNFEERHTAPTAQRDPPAYDAIAITGHGMTPSNQLLLNSKLAADGNAPPLEGKTEMDEDSPSEGDHLLYENDDRNCQSELERTAVFPASPRPQCLPAGHWRAIYSDDMSMRQTDLKSVSSGSPLRKGSLTLCARPHIGQPGMEPYYHTLGQPGYTTPQHPSHAPPSPYANLKRDQNTYNEDFTLASQKALNLPVLQTPRANRALKYPYDDVTSV